MLTTATALTFALLALGTARALPAAWSDFDPLAGAWVADSSGPGTPTGGFEFVPDLQGRVLVRRNFAEYPKTKDRPATRHEDLMVIFHQGAGTRADYYDNEGHVIRYAVTVEKGLVTF